MTVRGLPRRTLLALALALSGCGTSGPEITSFPPLRYNYLPVLKLKVSAISIEDDWQPSGGPDDLTSLAPETPDAALRQMAEDRLGAYGTSGRAVFVIEEASLSRVGSELDGAFAVRLDIYSEGDTRAASAEARVARSEPWPATSRVTVRQALYDFTRRMMDSMNVEFEYQIRRTLGEWLVSESATPTPVESQPLQAPGAQAPSVTPSPAPAPAPPTSSTTSPQGPQPGILGTLPLGPAPTTGAP